MDDTCAMDTCAVYFADARIIRKLPKYQISSLT